MSGKEKQDTKKVAEEKKPQEKQDTKKAEFVYFRNSYYSGLKLLARGGQDALGAEGVKETARFEPYYDTWKGDRVRVGYLKTDSKDIIKIARDDSRCEEITKQEYEAATVGTDKNPPLARAPQHMA